MWCERGASRVGHAEKPAHIWEEDANKGSCYDVAGAEDNTGPDISPIPDALGGVPESRCGQLKDGLAIHLQQGQQRWHQRKVSSLGITESKQPWHHSGRGSLIDCQQTDRSGAAA